MHKSADVFFEEYIYLSFLADKNKTIEVCASFPSLLQVNKSKNKNKQQIMSMEAIKEMCS